MALAYELLLRFEGRCRQVQIQLRVGHAGAHVAARPGEFDAIDFATAAARWPALPDEPSRDLRGSAALALLRMGENALNDRVWAM